MITDKTVFLNQKDQRIIWAFGTVYTNTQYVRGVHCYYSYNEYVEHDTNIEWLAQSVLDSINDPGTICIMGGGV